MMKRFIHKITYLTLLLMLGIMVLSGCKKLIEVPMPETELAKSGVFKEEATAKAAINSIYIALSAYSGLASGELSMLQAVYGDEMLSYGSANSTSYIPAFFYNNLVPANAAVSRTWGDCYSIIYKSNLAIEGLQLSTLSPMVKNQLLGEAYFFRAFCHLYLVNLYGDVPLVTSSDYRVNSSVARTPVTSVYPVIISDLVTAKGLLSDTYPSADRVKINKGAAIALLSRAYLYAGDYANAETSATEIIGNSSQYKLLTNLNNVFLKTSEEAIWQILPNGGLDNFTYEGSVFILTSIPPSNVSLRDELVTAFEPNDLRKANWIKSISSTSGLSTWYYPFKYKENNANKTGAEYSMVMRLAEQYLIRAEARAQLNKLTGANSATSDIDAIRGRAGLVGTSATTKDQLLNAVLKERQVELFSEWGHRFLDLKRFGKLDAVLTPLKPNWKAFRAVWPLPQSEILINKNLKQNTGY